MSEVLPARPVLLTKLVPPPVRAGAITRLRLLALLDGVRERPLTLVAAGAGFGKTTLVSQWLLEAQSAKRKAQSEQADEATLECVAWLSLDAGDNDPQAFWGTLLAAIDRAIPGVAATALQLFHQTPPVPIEAVLGVLLNALAVPTMPLLVVLDDYHQIESPAIHRGLTFLLERLPPHIHLILLTRADPPLPLARLRARDQLLEVRAEDLRFRPDEAASFLRGSMGLPLTPAQAAAVEERAEGWAVGLQLAALALRGHADPDSVLRGLSGNQRYILDYLVDEVLAQQPAHIQQFLLLTAVLERLSASLCDAVLGVEATGSPYSQLLLDELERQHLFLIPLDVERRWYRYHHLFATALRALLQRRAPEREPELHRRAARWHLANAQGDELLMERAFAHARAASDEELLADIVERFSPILLERSAAHVLERWLAAVPEALARARPRLALLRAWSLTLTGAAQEAAQWIGAAEVALPAELTAEQRDWWRGEVAAIRGTLAWQQGDLAGAAEAYRTADTLLPQASTLRSVTSANLGTVLALSGETGAARAAFAQAVALNVAQGRPLAVTMLGQQAQIEAIQGRLAQAEQLLGEALSRAQRAPAAHAPYLPALVAIQGELQYERNRLGEAAATFERAVALGQETFQIEPLLRGTLGLARVQAAGEAHNRAVFLLDELEHELNARGAPPWNRLGVAAARAEIALSAGNLATARAWAGRAGLQPTDMPQPLREAEYLLLARLLIAEGDQALAVPLLEQLVEQTKRGQRVINQVRAAALLALAEPRAHRPVLDEALRLASRAGFVRSILDLGPALRPLLTIARVELGAHDATLRDYLDRLLTAARQNEERIADAPSPSGPPGSGAQDAEALVEPLSVREREVLDLLAMGMTNQQIADRLVITERTAKKHVTNILGKLGARNRTEAAARARELGLV